MNTKTTDIRFEAEAKTDWTLEDVADAKADHDRVRIERDALSRPATAEANQRKASDVRGLEALLFASDFNDHIEMAVLYDPDAELYAVVSGHKRSEAWNTVEHDWKVHSIGSELVVKGDPEEYESDFDREEFESFVRYELVEDGDDRAIYEIVPGTGSDSIEIEFKDAEGLTTEGYRITVSLTAGDGEE